jgi:hypothetical protein
MKKVKRLLRATGLFILLISARPLFIYGSFPAGEGDVIRFNSSFKMKRMSNGEVIVTNPEETTLKNLTFKDMYADIILAAYRNQKMDYVIETCSRKYYLSDDECRREVKHALNVLSEWKIVFIESSASKS